MLAKLPETKEAFFAELSNLKARFEAMKPEMEVTLRDPICLAP